MNPHMSQRFSMQRLLAITRKETLQVFRDPSTLLVAFVLPLVLLLLFAYAVSLDTRNVRIGVVLESDTEAAQSLAAAFAGSRYFAVTPTRDRREAAPLLTAGKLRGYVVIPQDFDRRLQQFPPQSVVQVITDGTQPNTATFVANYARGTVQQWLQDRGVMPTQPVALQQRFWFNPEMETRRALVPGALAIIMTMIGTLLTALVVAREWERGTMEGLFATPATPLEILTGKLVPYFVLGLLATALTTAMAVWVFGIPLRGSVFTLLFLSAVFLLPALGQGLLISTLARNQFIASQVALLAGFLPAFLLSGFLFEISSMPLPLQLLTHLVPARYFNSALQTVFLAGDVWPLLWPAIGAMFLLGVILMALVARNTRKSLER
ncbi:ABC transporter permease [Pseudomaricurvus sp. HS19]|uniref:ABC transporter permease n=1 Tax=Pseudomaricurvus sp. HS19 TaxID=2692626 RepID=UPI0013702A1D|nr:ABC transporter permease [Pseudomaricurvus sp. HS19]MYM64470.1 ABC transporter permease [Pseudomaricurvus sp. HS19]